MMTEVQLPVLAHRLLPAASQLHPSSCCPTRDLAALTALSTPTAAQEAKLSLCRTTGTAHLVWEWSPPAQPAPAAAAPKPRGLFNAKPKAGGGGSIQQLAWSPDGQYCATVAHLRAQSSPTLLHRESPRRRGPHPLRSAFAQPPLSAHWHLPATTH